MEMQDGLFAPVEKNNGNEIEKAVDALFIDLEEKNLLTPVEKAKRAMLIKTAKALDSGLSSSKITVATSNLLTKTLDVLETLPREVQASDSMDAWDAAILDATAAAMADGTPADDLIPVNDWSTQ